MKKAAELRKAELTKIVIRPENSMAGVGPDGEDPVAAERAELAALSDALLQM